MQNIRILALAALATVPFAASAADLGLANNFNAFIQNNATVTGGHSGGSIAIGGSLSGGYDVAQQSATGSLGGQTMGLYVGGTSTASGSVNQGKSYFGTYSGSMNFNGGPRGATTSAMNTDFSTTYSNLLLQSAAITTLASTYGNSFNLSNQNSIKAVSHDGGTVNTVGDSNNLNINVTQYTVYKPTASQSVYVFNMNADAFQAFNNMQITWTGLDSTHTLLVNVTDNDNNINWIPKQQVSSGNHYVLYNFGTATSLTVGNNDSFNGSILAPNAAVTQKRNIQGNLIAKSWSTVGAPELHFDNDGSSKFLGWVPPVPSQPVPEPGTWAVLGLGAAAMLRRRRK